MKITLVEDFGEQQARIKIVGLGGGGGNAINRMAQAKIKGVELVSVNTDAQALKRSLAHSKIQIGSDFTRGLGAGGNPEVGKKAAEESREDIKGEIAGADMLFITAGMGGGTGTGSAPVVAELARSLKALTVGVVTYPFTLEGKVRMQQAEAGIKELRALVDTLLVIPNDRLFEIGTKDMTWLEGFRLADDVLRQAIQAITDIITNPGIINVDFADVKQIMSGAGEALMGIGEAEGPERTMKAIKSAIKSPLLEKVSVEGARGVLVNITGGNDLKIKEVEDALRVTMDFASHDAHVYYGQVIDPELQGRVKITLIATGFPPRKIKQVINEKNVKSKISQFGDENGEEGNIERPAYLRCKSKKL